MPVDYGSRKALICGVQDIDGEREDDPCMSGKGGKDRYVPLPEPGLEMLRRYWVTHRHPIWLFPSPFGVGGLLSSATQPSHCRGSAGKPSIVQCRNVSSRNRRPSILYATPMQRICSMPGYPYAIIQAYLGHSSPLQQLSTPTCLKRAMTRPSIPINQVLENLWQ